MGKREVRVILVPKSVTGALLILTSTVIIAIIFALTGRAYAIEPLTIRALVARTMQQSPHQLLAAVMPFAANALLFVPWGFLAFILFDRPSRPRARTYAMTLIGGILFAAAIAAWQSLLPTHVTTISDSIANAAGTFAGAILGHMRKQVRVRFEH